MKATRVHYTHDINIELTREELKKLEAGEGIHTNEGEFVEVDEFATPDEVDEVEELVLTSDVYIKVV